MSFLAGAVDPANRYPTEQERAAMREFPSRADAFAYLVELSQGEYPARSGKKYRIYDAEHLASRSGSDREARRARLAEIRASTGCSASYAYVLLRQEVKTASVEKLLPGREDYSEEIILKYQKQIRAGEGINPLEVWPLKDKDRNIYNYQVVEGHHRLEAAKREGLKEVPIKNYNSSSRVPRQRGPRVNVEEKIIELELRLAKLRRRLAELPARIEDLEAQLRRYAGSTQQPPMKPEVA